MFEAERPVSVSTTAHTGALVTRLVAIEQITIIG